MKLFQSNLQQLQSLVSNFLIGGDIVANSETIEVLLSGAFEVIPNFISTETNIPVVINEINYRSIDTLDTDDWIELYNPNTSEQYL